MNGICSLKKRSRIWQNRRLCRSSLELCTAGRISTQPSAGRELAATSRRDQPESPLARGRSLQSNGPCSSGGTRSCRCLSAGHSYSGARRASAAVDAVSGDRARRGADAAVLCLSPCRGQGPRPLGNDDPSVLGQPAVYGSTARSLALSMTCCCLLSAALFALFSATAVNKYFIKNPPHMSLFDSG